MGTNKVLVLTEASKDHKFQAKPSLTHVIIIQE
jgi:hypothetical protein